MVVVLECGGCGTTTDEGHDDICLFSLPLSLSLSLAIFIKYVGLFCFLIIRGLKKYVFAYVLSRSMVLFMC